MKKLFARNLIKLIVVFAVSGVFIFLSQRNFDSAAKLVKEAELKFHQMELMRKEFSSSLANPDISTSELARRSGENATKIDDLGKETNRMGTQHESQVIYGWLFRIIGIGIPLVYLILRWAMDRYSAVEP